MTLRHRFLLVDDEPDVRMVLTGFLNELGHCETAAAGHEALAAMNRALEEKRPYDAVFLDIVMPGMDGHETASMLRKAEREHGVEPHNAFKLVMVSSLDDTGNVCKSFFRDGLADAYVAKPVDHGKLMDELRALKITD